MASTVRARHSLTTRITIAVLAIFLIGLWSLLFYASRILRHDMEQLLGEQQFSTASHLAKDVDDELSSRLATLERIAEKVTPSLLAKPAALQTYMEERLEMSQPFNGGVVVMGRDGTAVADVPRSTGRIGINYLDVDAVASALKDGKSAIGRPVMGRKLQAPVFGMAVPIHDARGAVIGALHGVTNLGKPNFLDKLTEGRHGKTGGYLLVAPQHRLIVTATDKRLVLTPVPSPGASTVVDRFIQGYEGSGILVNSVGEEMLASAKSVPVAGWYVAVAMPTAEAFAPLRTMQQHMLLATIFLTLLAGGLTWWMVKLQLSPLLVTSRLLATLSDENRPTGPLPFARQDEIGLLIASFNRLLESLAQRDELLHESEFSLRQALDSAQLGEWELDLATQSVRRSRRHGEIFGQSEPLPDWTFNTFADHIHPEERARVLSFIHDHSAAGADFHTEFRIVRDDGAVRWVWIRGHFLHDSQGRPSKMRGLVADITEQKTMEAVLRQSEQYKQAILDSVHLQIAVLDPYGYIVTVNDTWRRFAVENGTEPGRPAQRTGVGVNYLEICQASEGADEEAAHRAYEGIRMVLDGRLPSFSLEYSCHAPNEQRWFCMTATPFGPEKRGAVITHDDITARRALYDILESKTLLQGVIDSTPDWIHVKDREHRFMLVSRGFAAAFNMTPGDMIGRLDSEVLPHEVCVGDPYRGIRGLHPDDDAVFAGQTIHDPRDRIVLDNGEVRVFDTFKGPLRDAAQNIYGVLTYRRDITKSFVTEQGQKALETQLRQAQKMELIGHLTGGIAHDFNNILAAMFGYAELIQMDIDRQKSPQLYGHIEEILQAGIRAKELVSQLLTFSQRKETATEAIDVAPIIEEVTRLLRSTMPTSITIKTGLANDLPKILISPVQLHQVVMNLGINARDAMANDGTIHIHAARVNIDNDKACDSCHDPFSGTYLMISVRDSGVGIAPENLPKIFDPFFTTKDVGRGSGLGLSVLHGIVHSSKGHISVMTTPGAGTEFRVYLPAQAQESALPAEQSKPEQAHSPLRGHIMVVDDELSIVRFMTTLLENLGCRVTGLTSASEALRIFEADPHGVDMVITDQTMPDLTGAKLAAAMLASRADIPIVLITGYSTAIDAEMARDIGIRRLLFKPVPARVLIDIVAEYLGAGRREDRRAN